MGQLAVVGQHQQSLGLEVEATDGKHTRLRGDELGDDRTIVGVGSGRDVTCRLVQQVMDPPRRHTHQGAVDLDDVGVGIDPVPEHGNPTVHGHPARGDHLLDHAAAGDTASGEHLLQPHRRHVGRRFGHRTTRSRCAGR